MQKEDAIRIITSCAKIYNQELENKNLLFVFGSVNHTDSFEASFLPKHFLHLTGVDVSTTNFKGSSDFYEKCLKGKLSPHDFKFAQNGTTDMKLQVLPQLMKIQNTAKMVGNYNFSKSLLLTEKLAGNITSCMGFVRDDKYYIPNTALKEDIRNLTTSSPQRILATFRKPILDLQYHELCYVAKGIDFSMLNLPNSVFMASPDKCKIQQNPSSITEKENTPYNNLLIQITHQQQTKDQAPVKTAKSTDPER